MKFARAGVTALGGEGDGYFFCQKVVFGPELFPIVPLRANRASANETLVVKEAVTSPFHQSLVRIPPARRRAVAKWQGSGRAKAQVRLRPFPGYEMRVVKSSDTSLLTRMLRVRVPCGEPLCAVSSMVERRGCAKAHPQSEFACSPAVFVKA